MFLLKQEGKELPFRQEKTRKWLAQISANAIKIRMTDSNLVANNGNENQETSQCSSSPCAARVLKCDQCCVIRDPGLTSCCSKDLNCVVVCRRRLSSSVSVARTY